VRYKKQEKRDILCDFFAVGWRTEWGKGGEKREKMKNKSEKEEEEEEKENYV
jgi:hypothetical protein